MIFISDLRLKLNSLIENGVDKISSPPTTTPTRAIKGYQIKLFVSESASAHILGIGLLYYGLSVVCLVVWIRISQYED